MACRHYLNICWPSALIHVCATRPQLFTIFVTSWRRHHMEKFPVLLALCAGKSPVTGEFPSQRPVTRSFVVSLICALNKRSSKESWGWWFETPSRSLWRQCNVNIFFYFLNTDVGTLFYTIYCNRFEHFAKLLSWLCFSFPVNQNNKIVKNNQLIPII